MESEVSSEEICFKAFLSNRSQLVSINGAQSSPKPVLSGVPRGSILGPVLFLLYINDITKCINANLRLFADDCIFYSEIRSSQDCLALQNDLEQLSSCMVKKLATWPFTI